VRALWRQGYAVSSGSACSALKGNAQGGAASGSASPILLAMGYGPEEAASGLRLSLGPWHRAADLEALPQALERARQEVAAAAAL
jgi:cysteine desulfurase